MMLLPEVIIRCYLLRKEYDGFSLRLTEFEVSMGYPSRDPVHRSEKQKLLFAFGMYLFIYLSLSLSICLTLELKFS